MIIPILPKKHRKRPPKVRKPFGTPGPVALVLVAAVYDEGPVVTLTFDRAIDIAAIDVTQIFVNDGAIMFFRYVGWDEAWLTSPTTVRVQLNGISEDPPPGVHLTADADSGIVAVDDGGTWSGVTDLSLPFP